MSWSITFIGKSSNVANAIENTGETWDDQSKLEYNDVKSHLSALVMQNFSDNNGEPIIKIQASGSGHSVNGKQLQRSFTVLIEGFYGQLV